MQRKVTLLITSTGGAMAPGAFLELRHSSIFDYRLIGVNASAPIPAQKILDAFYRIPEGHSPHYAAELMAIIKKEQVEVVLPASDEEAFVLSALSEKLARDGIKTIVSPPDCLDLISDKHKTYENLEKAGVRVPKFTAVHDLEALVRVMAQYGYPEKSVIIKPSKGRGGRGLNIFCGHDSPPPWLGSGKRETRINDVLSREQLLAKVKSVQEEILVMPCLTVPAFDADVVFISEGQYSIIVRKRLNPPGIPFEGNQIVCNSSITSYCKSIAKSLNLKAFHDIDLMTDPEGNPVVLEVNPRPSGSLAASLAAGFPLIDWAVAGALGLPITVSEPKQDIEIRPFTCTFALSV